MFCIVNLLVFISKVGFSEAGTGFLDRIPVTISFVVISFAQQKKWLFTRLFFLVTLDIRPRCSIGIFKNKK